jgi:hypothetical protein
MVLLALLGASTDTIAADYELSAGRLRPEHSGVDDVPMIERFLAERGTDAGRLIAETLAAVDIEATMRRGGLTDGDVEALRERLVEA